MSLSAPLVRGRNVKMSYRQNGVKVLALFKTASIEEMANEVADSVNGEPRDRFDLVVDGYKLALTGYAPDFLMLDSFLADTANDDASNPQFSKAVSMVMALLDGTSVGYRLSGASSSRGAFRVEIGGRKETVLQTVAYRFPYLSKVPT